MKYDESGDLISDGMIVVRIERGGEYVFTEVPEGSTVKALIEGGHLRGIEVANTRINGAPAGENKPLSNGDTVAQIPKSGVQG